MSFRRSSIVIAALCFSLAGCPSSSTPTPTNVPVEDIGSYYGDAFCAILTDCYGETLRNELLGIGSEAECAATLERQYEEAALPLYEQAIADGTVTYDPAALAPCLDAIEASGCGFLMSRMTSICDDLFVGDVVAGGACSINEQCAGDAYCQTMAACPGTCQPRGAVGTPCTGDEACQSGMKCSAGACAVPSGEGAPCGGGTMGGNQCAGGLICAGASGGAAGTCRSPDTVLSGALHGACNVMMTQLCEPGLSCVVVSLADMSCEPGDLAMGATCHLAVPDQCSTGAYCSDTNISLGDTEGTCAALPGVGDPCAMVVIGPTCATGLRCEMGMCRETHETGGSCETAADCYSARCTSGTCAAPMLCE